MNLFMRCACIVLGLSCVLFAIHCATHKSWHNFGTLLFCASTFAVNYWTLKIQNKWDKRDREAAR